MAKAFASSEDTGERPGTLEELADGVYAFTADGDPNVGAIVGSDGVLCIDARATPTLAREWLTALRQVTDAPIRYLLLTHYHAVRTLGAAAFAAPVIVCHDGTRRLIEERGEADFASEVRRFPRLFTDVESVPGLTRPTMTFTGQMRISLGDRTVVLAHLGRGHTEGDAVAWLPQERVLFAGDLVEANATPYCGDAFLRSWRRSTLNAVAGLGATTMVPGRGPALRGPDVRRAIADTRDYLDGLCAAVEAAIAAGGDLRAAFASAYDALSPRYGDTAIFDHSMPFNVARAYEELAGEHPRIWTAARDQELWKAVHG